MPVLFPENIFVKVVPSAEVEITKLYWRDVPSVQAIPTLQIDFCTA